MLNVDLIELKEIQLNEFAESLLENALRKSESEEEYFRRHPKYDWQRLQFGFSRIKPGKKCLEIGPGRGYLTTILHRSKVFEEIHAIDIVDRTKRLPKDVNFKIEDVSNLSFTDGEFDTVICMEVLEHLDTDSYYSALSEIRRVCGGKLIVTVPFNEPMPSKYHLQSFSSQRIMDEYPDGKYSLLLKSPIMRVPWLMIEEIH